MPCLGMPTHHIHPVLLRYLQAVACTSSQPRSAAVCCSLTPAASSCLLLQCIAEIRIAQKPFGSYGDVSAPAFVERLPNGAMVFSYAHAGYDYGREFEIRRLYAPERPPPFQPVFVLSFWSQPMLHWAAACKHLCNLCAAAPQRL